MDASTTELGVSQHRPPITIATPDHRQCFLSALLPLRGSALACHCSGRTGTFKPRSINLLLSQKVSSSDCLQHQRSSRTSSGPVCGFLSSIQDITTSPIMRLFHSTISRWDIQTTSFSACTGYTSASPWLLQSGADLAISSQFKLSSKVT
jgi:hypothetical protein